MGEALRLDVPHVPHDRVAVFRTESAALGHRAYVPQGQPHSLRVRLLALPARFTRFAQRCLGILKGLLLLAGQLRVGHRRGQIFP